MGLQNQRLIDQTIRLVRGIDSLELEISFAADLGWDIRQRFVEAGLGILEKQRRDQTYALHVSNFPATAWLETLAANIPTVCLFDPQVTVFRNASLGRIEALERVGILHQSPESAAYWIRKVYDCPEIWWETDEVQEARSAFVSRYARLENCWEERWSEEFRRISSAQN